MARSVVRTETVQTLFQRRVDPLEQLAGQSDGVARACHAMAVRFHQGGKLVVFGNGGPSTDAQHVAVEFVHPVIVGKRALPAISLTGDVATVTGVAVRAGLAEVFAHQIRILAEPADIALGISSDGHCANVLRGLEVAHGMGMLTVALVGGDGGVIGSSPAVWNGAAQPSRPVPNGAAQPSRPVPNGAAAPSRSVDHVLLAASDDPRVVKEVHVTTYHVLWELVHVFFEQPGLLGPEVVR